MPGFSPPSSGGSAGSLFGALGSSAPASGVAFQCYASRDAFLTVPVTFNPTAGATATCLVEISPDNSVFTTLVTLTFPVGVTFDGIVNPVTLVVPAGWYVRLTVTNAVLGTARFY